MIISSKRYSLKIKIKKSKQTKNQVDEKIIKDHHISLTQIQRLLKEGSLRPTKKKKKKVGVENER